MYELTPLQEYVLKRIDAYPGFDQLWIDESKALISQFVKDYEQEHGGFTDEDLAFPEGTWNE